MKRVLFLALGAAMFIGCSKDDNDTDDAITAADTEAVKSVAQSGEWRISNYTDSGKDETADYSGYSFTFGSDGTLGVTDGNTSLSGAWSITSSDDSQDDDSSDDDIDFNILFNGSELFEELSDDWDIVKYSNTKIELFDVSGGDGTTDYLTFEKM